MAVVSSPSSVASSLPSEVDVLGVRVVPFESHAQAVKCVGHVISSGVKTFWAAVNPQKIYRAWNDPKVRDVLDEADAGLIDGVGVSWASKILTGWFLPRCTGCDLFFALLAEASHAGWRVFLLGASPESNAQAAEAVTKRFPGLVVAGRQDGFFSDDQDAIDKINAARADIVFVAMGSPRQEFWIAKHRDRIDARFFLGVGGSFDVAAGVSRRAPVAVRRLGLEFLYQLATQPWRWRRQIVYIPFVLRVAAERLKRRPQRSRGRTKQRRQSAASEAHSYE